MFRRPFIFTEKHFIFTENAQRCTSIPSNRYFCNKKAHFRALEVWREEGASELEVDEGLDIAGLNLDDDKDDDDDEECLDDKGGTGDEVFGLVGKRSDIGA